VCGSRVSIYPTSGVLFGTTVFVQQPTVKRASRFSHRSVRKHKHPPFQAPHAGVGVGTSAS